MKNTWILIALFSFFLRPVFAQAIVVQDTAFYPKAMRKHVEVVLFGSIKGVGFGFSTYKNKHSWAYSLNGAKRNVRTIYLPINDIFIGSVQAEYRHRINTQRAPVFWHVDFGLNYLKYKQKSTLFINEFTLSGSRFYPNFGFGTGYFIAISDKKNIEIQATVNFQSINRKISEQINSVFTAKGNLFVNSGIVPIIKFRYSF